MAPSVQTPGPESVPSQPLLDGIDGPYETFTTVYRLRTAVRKFIDRLYEGKTASQYMVFKSVLAENFEQIENQRHEISKGRRFTYCQDIQTLIIKVPTSEHEEITRVFTHSLIDRVVTMGLSYVNSLKDMGSTAYKGTSVSKEPDSCFQPCATRPQRSDWPTLVFEVGISESLTKLRTDARWWLVNSASLVKIVLIIHVNRGSGTLEIEKWECATATNRPSTRSNQPPAQIPTQMQRIVIAQNGVSGQIPLVLHFHNIFLRQPTPPERDVIFTAQDLQRLADGFWMH